MSIKATFVNKTLYVTVSGADLKLALAGNMLGAPLYFGGVYVQEQGARIGIEMEAIHAIKALLKMGEQAAADLTKEYQSKKFDRVDTEGSTDDAGTSRP